MDQISREFQVFVKPVSGRCNLGCSYCYYLGKENLVPGATNVLMSYEVLEQYIRGHIEAAGEDLIFFSWHGGEPTLAGIEFFRKAIQIQKKLQPEGKRIINGIQTNGVLLNEEWCNFLADEDFVVGISMDGPEGMHDRYRTGKDERPTFGSVVTGFRLLLDHGVTPEILCVVNSYNVQYPVEVYSFFKDIGARLLTFLPLVEKLEGKSHGVSERSVPSMDFGIFLSRIFDEWIEKDIGKIKIQIFEEAARTAFKQEHTLCIFKQTCGGVPVVEHNGDFYSCDHYVNPEHRLGNIFQQALSELLDHPRQIEFGEAKQDSLPSYCLQCEVLDICNGECPRNRFITTPDGEAGLNYLCEGYKHFFRHCKPFVDAVSVQWQ